MNALRLGTRRSALATVQAQLVADALTATGDVEVELVPITTYGDETQREQLPLETIGAWPDVRSICRDGDRFEIVTDAAESVVRQLLGEDSRLSELEVQRAGLAEAFVEITQEAA